MSSRKQTRYSSNTDPIKGTLDPRPGPVYCIFCGAQFETRSRQKNLHQDICEFYGYTITPRPHDLPIPQAYLTFIEFCNIHHIGSKKYRDSFLLHIKGLKKNPDLLKLTEPDLAAAFETYKGVSI